MGSIFNAIPLVSGIFSGKEGQSAPTDTASQTQSQKANQALQSYTASGASDSRISDLINSYAQGHISLQDAIDTATRIGGQSGANALLTAPSTASKAAQEQALSSPTLAGMFNPGGQLSQAQQNYTTYSSNLASDRDALMGRDQSYGLTDQDLAAYGQAAGNIARMFGGQQQSLSQAMANQGLGAADSGSARQGFSTVYGNQMEQLAGLQSQIAQNRIQTAQQLAQARTQADLNAQAQAQGYVQGLGTLGQNAITNAFNRNLQGSQNAYNQIANTAGSALQNQQLQQAINNEQFAQLQQTKQPGMLDQTISALNAAPGQVISGIAGGAGKGGGTAAGQSTYSAMGGQGGSKGMYQIQQSQNLAGGVPTLGGSVGLGA